MSIFSWSDEYTSEVRESLSAAIDEARAAGVVEERARNVAILRAESEAWMRKWREFRTTPQLTLADAFSDMADRIERGEK